MHRSDIIRAGGNMADFFTVAVRTGKRGMGGLSLLLLEKSMPGTWWPDAYVTHAACMVFISEPLG